MAKPTSTHRVFRFLEQKIRETRPGDALPSIRQVIRTCEVSQATVSTVVKELEQHNWLEVRAQRGLYRSGSAQSGPTIKAIDVLYCNTDEHRRSMITGQMPYDSSFHGDLMKSLHHVAKDRDMEIRLHATHPGESDADMAYRVADDPKVKACVTVSLADPSLTEVLKRAQVVFVNLFPASFTLPVNTITTDPEKIVELQVQALVDQGHRRIAHLHQAKEARFTRGTMLRRAGFYRLAWANALPFHPGYVAYGGFTNNRTRVAAESVLNCNPRPTGLICPDMHLPVVYEVAKSMGLKIGVDLSVVGTDDRDESSQMDPPTSTIRVPRNPSIEQAFSLLNEVACGKTLMPEHYQRIDVSYVSRQSIGKAPA